ncbi:ABC transporter permease [Ruminococcaceae bacterium OttesenSCG-928-D13]|nr:ABC transporter permease [Ruminococcaceae bacterium OttesenSCG-928-D13]
MTRQAILQKKTKTRRLKRYPELTAIGIGWGASACIGLLVLGGCFAGENGFVFGGMFVIALLYLGMAVLCLAVYQAARHSIAAGGGIPIFCRRLGWLMVASALCGNVFAAIAGFSIVKEKRSLEYNLCSYAILGNLLVLLITLLNLFKEYVARFFMVGIGLLLASVVLYVVALPLIERAQTPEQYRKLKPLAIILIASALLGNLFAAILGLVILMRIKNEGSARSIEWVDIVRRIYRNYMAVMGFFIITILIVLAITCGMTFDYEYAISIDYDNLLHPPSLAYPFGTDNTGLCVFTRIVYGAQISLAIGLVSTAVPIVVGGLLGAMAGYYSERLDNGIMRILDVVYAIPSTLLTIAIVAAFGANTVNLILALSISNIPIYARTMRAQVMTVSNSEFVEAARSCGRHEWQILILHIIPNSLAQIIVRASVSIGIAVLSTSSLSYLGLGVEPHIPEWGNILKVGSPYLETHPYLAIYPGLFIIVLVLAFNFLGDGLRDALDPKLK